MLTGAGISVGSGIPTYRDKSGVWQRNTPIQHQAFITSSAMRQRYWLRSFKGWPSVSTAEPSPTHHAIAALESGGLLELTVTQNVDRLHQRAGSANVVDLHGRLDEVICMSCGDISSRESMQRRLAQEHPWLVKELDSVTGTLAPDGDAEVEVSLAKDISPPHCLRCDGILKPNVVFFGDNVPKQIVQSIYDTIEAADGLVVAGTSLQVFSGYRFCRYAETHNKPIACINPGVTRADSIVTLKVAATTDTVFPGLLRMLSA